MKFGIDMGHNCPPHDIGASGVKQEDDLTKDVGTRLIKKLRDARHTVIDCTPSSASSLNDSLSKRVKKANDNNVDIFVSIHFNAFKPIDGPRGSEIFAISSAAKGIARPVLQEIVALGFVDRDVKSKPRFFVLRNTSMPAILIECCFVDSKADMALYDAEKMAEAIKVGLIGESDDPPTPQPATLRITRKTILKPSTEQSGDLDSTTLVEIDPGDYPVLNSRLEERHFWVQWPDKSLGDRDEHFIFEEFAELIES